MFENLEYNAYNHGITVENNKISIKNVKEVEYEVIWSKNIFDINNKQIINICKGKTLSIFISPNINRLYGEKIRNYFDYYKADLNYNITEVKTSEFNKTFSNVEKICQCAKKNSLDRNGIMIGIGGGIINDLVGFAASIYKRGVDYIRINTTLLGQVDVAVGIKTGVNMDNSKNFLGSYYPPIAAINDITFLKTLDVEEIKCGLSEMIKMGIILDKNLFELIENTYQSFLNHDFEYDNVYEAIARAKLRMIEELYPNLYENDLRRLVDFGHSFSQKIEVLSNFEIKHGIAVAIDMAISSRLSVLLGILEEKDFVRIINLLLNVGLPIYEHKTCTLEMLINSIEDMYLHRGKKINVVIPSAIGKATFIYNKFDLSISVLRQAINDLKELYRQTQSKNVS